MEDTFPKQRVDDMEDRVPDEGIADKVRVEDTAATGLVCSSSKQSKSILIQSELLTKQHATPIQMPMLHQGMEGALLGENRVSSEAMQHSRPIPMHCHTR